MKQNGCMDGCFGVRGFYEAHVKGCPRLKGGARQERVAEAKDLHLDVDFETARALHRVVRGMHDGECPKCHAISDSRAMREPGGLDLICPRCGFRITDAEQTAAIRAFAPVMERNLAVFEGWRAKLSGES